MLEHLLHQMLCLGYCLIPGIRRHHRLVGLLFHQISLEASLSIVSITKSLPEQYSLSNKLFCQRQHPNQHYGLQMGCIGGQVWRPHIRGSTLTVFKDLSHGRMYAVKPAAVNTLRPRGIHGIEVLLYLYSTSRALAWPYCQSLCLSLPCCMQTITRCHLHLTILLRSRNVLTRPSVYNRNR
jgi:hypothetical protein